MKCRVVVILLVSGMMLSCGSSKMNGDNEVADQNEEIILGDNTEVELGDDTDVSDSADLDEETVIVSEDTDDSAKGEDSGQNEGDCVPKVLTFDAPEPDKDDLFLHGSQLVDQYADEGVSFAFSVNKRSFDYGILFDSTIDNAFSPDRDLYIDPARTEDGFGLGKVLILSENNKIDDTGLFTKPDDNAWGGTITVTFANTVRFDGITMIDIEERHTDTSVEFFNDDALVGTHVVEPMNDNDFRVETFAATEPSKELPEGNVMLITLAGSGAVDNIAYCEFAPVTK